MTATMLVVGAFVAGHETMLIAGAALRLELARDPALQDRLRAEPGPDRPNAARHLAYGHGVHRCAGAAMAEQELRIPAEEALPHGFRLAGGVLHAGPTGTGSFLGFARLPLVPA